jgi:protein TonB
MAGPLQTAPAFGRDRAAAWRWSVCAALVIALHAALLVILAPHAPRETQVEPVPPISIDLPPESTKPAAAKSPDPEQVLKLNPALNPEPNPRTEPPPSKTAQTKNAGKPPSQSQPPRSPPPAKPIEQKSAKPANTPPENPHRMLNLTPDLASAPRDFAAGPESTDDSGELESYKRVLDGYVFRHAAYPPIAKALHQEGVVYVAFVLDREGRVLSFHLDRSSGFSALDNEALAVFARSQPFPSVPSDLPDPLTVVMPFRFSLSR